jgi:hypothetical protein
MVRADGEAGRVVRGDADRGFMRDGRRRGDVVVREACFAHVPDQRPRLRAPRPRVPKTEANTPSAPTPMATVASTPDNAASRTDGASPFRCSLGRLVVVIGTRVSPRAWFAAGTTQLD